MLKTLKQKIWSVHCDTVVIFLVSISNITNINWPICRGPQHIPLVYTIVIQSLDYWLSRSSQDRKHLTSDWLIFGILQSRRHSGATDFSDAAALPVWVGGVRRLDWFPNCNGWFLKSTSSPNEDLECEATLTSAGKRNKPRDQMPTCSISPAHHSSSSSSSLAALHSRFCCAHPFQTSTT